MIDQDVALLHRNLVAIPSLSHQEKAAADLMEAHLREAGLNVTRTGDNVVAEWGSGDRTLLLNSHLDVVPPSANHPFPPFTPTLSEGRLYGRGSVDAKASVASMATAVCRLAREGYHPDGRVLVAFTVCEETGGENNGLEEIFPSLPRPHAALVGEPTHMQPCVAQKGLLILRLDAAGVSAHAARAEEGENAILKMVRDLARLEAYEFERIHPYLGRTTANVTMIEGGSARNMIPDSCSAFIDIRSTPSYSHDEIARLLQHELESHVHIHSKRFVPVDTAPDEDIVLACLEGSAGSKAFGSPTMSDWIHLKGIPTVKIGPGDSRLSHTDQESIPVQELVDSCQTYVNIIKSYFKTS
jgi:acetylornithine deacetylase